MIDCPYKNKLQVFAQIMHEEIFPAPLLTGSFAALDCKKEGKICKYSFSALIHAISCIINGALVNDTAKIRFISLSY